MGHFLEQGIPEILTQEVVDEYRSSRQSEDHVLIPVLEPFQVLVPFLVLLLTKKGRREIVSLRLFAS
jgi:hypothetical protein